MYAIVEIAGQQFKVAKNQSIFVHRLDAEEGRKITFDKVLLLDDKGKITLGAPAIEGAAVEAKIVEHLKGDKVIVFKKKRRKGYRVKNGHRQLFTKISIEDIISSGAKKATSEKTEAKKTETKKAEAKTSGEKPAKKAETTSKASAKAPAKEKDKEDKTEKAPAKKTTRAKAEDLNEKTVAELREMAKEIGMTGYSGMKKAELIAELNKNNK